MKDGKMVKGADGKPFRDQEAEPEFCENMKLFHHIYIKPQNISI
jgi:hypothetical protein